MDGEARAALVAWRMEEAAEALAAARLAFDHGLHRSTVNRAYYAAFYAASAALLTEGISMAKHTGVQGELHRLLVRRGRLPALIGRAFTHLFEERLRGDYREGIELSADEAAEALAAAEQIVDAIRSLLNEGA